MSQTADCTLTRKAGNLIFLYCKKTYLCIGIIVGGYNSRQTAANKFAQDLKNFMEDMFYIMEIIVQPVDGGASVLPDRNQPMKMRGPAAWVCVFSNKRTTAETCICLLFEHRVVSANWTKPRLTDYISRQPSSTGKKKNSCDILVEVNKGCKAKSLVLFYCTPPVQQHCLLLCTKGQSILFHKCCLQSRKGSWNTCFVFFSKQLGSDCHCSHAYLCC